MTTPANVIYLPPGVIPPQIAAQSASGGGIPFDRQFFETMLPQALKSYCEQVHCDSPQVIVATIDGAVHHVVAVSGVASNWVAVQATREDHHHPMEIFLPYQTIYRVEIHPAADEGQRHLGYILPTDGRPTPVIEAVAGPKQAKPGHKRTAAKK